MSSAQETGRGRDEEERDESCAVSTRKQEQKSRSILTLFFDKLRVNGIIRGRHHSALSAQLSRRIVRRITPRLARRLIVPFPSILSDFREIPDSQEVYLSESDDTSVILEVLESVTPADSVDAIT